MEFEMTADAETPESLHATLSRRSFWLIMISVILGMLLSALDQTVVGTAMPRIVADLGGLNHYSWVFTSYMLASTVMVPIYGKLSDIYGRRWFFIGGMLIFLLGSALSGLAGSMTQLILFRGLQGLGAGAMMPIAMALIGDILPPLERGKWQGVMMAVFGLATIVGPSLGGWLTDNLGWQWVFYVNMPVGIIAVAMAFLVLPGHSSRRSHVVDYLGATLLVLGTVPLLLGISWGGTEYPWSSPQVIGLLVFGALVLTAFMFIESHAAEPIVAPSLFRNRIFTVSVIATFMVSAGMYGATMYLPLFVQGVIGESATNSGAILTPMMLGFMVSSVIGGQIMSRTGRYKILAIVGFVIATAGMFLLSRMTVDATSGLLVRNMIITGLGIGVMMSLFTIVVQNAFPFRKLGEVTANLQFFRSIGGTIGVAILGTVMTNQFGTAFDANLPQSLQQAIPAEQLATFRNPQILLAPGATEQIQHAFDAFGAQGQQLFQQLMLVIRESLATSITDLFFIGMLLMVIGLVASFFLEEIPLRKGHHEEGVVAEADAPFAQGPGEWAAGDPSRVPELIRSEFTNTNDDDR